VDRVLGNDAGLSLFIGQFAATELRQPQLDEIDRSAIGSLGITSSNDAVCVSASALTPP
jgi:hypothetical protein